MKYLAIAALTLLAACGNYQPQKCVYPTQFYRDGICYDKGKVDAPENEYGPQFDLQKEDK